MIVLNEEEACKLRDSLDALLEHHIDGEWAYEVIEIDNISVGGCRLTARATTLDIIE